MKAFNSAYFRKHLDFWFEFVPQIVLMLSLFGWMDFLIIYKWLIPWRGGEQEPKETNIFYAPSIISLLIAMFLNQGNVNEEVETYLVGSNQE